MKKIVFKTVGAAIGLAVLGTVAMVSLHAQPGSPPTRAAALTTNWVGYLVSGEYRRAVLIDPMPGSGPFSRIVPEANPRVEIGLRSDGVVLWHTVPKPK